MDNITANMPSMPSSPLPTSGKSFKTLLTSLKGPKLIFVILGIFVLLEVIFAVRSLKSNSPAASVKTAQPVGGGNIVITSDKKSYAVGEKVLASVKISTGGHTTDGTDLILRYDTKILEASSSTIAKGKVYPDYPIAAVDGKTGVIRISGISSIQKSGFNGVGVFAIIGFKAKAPGQAALKIDFKPGGTTDSNIVESKTAKDVLENVTNLNITIK